MSRSGQRYYQKLDHAQLYKSVPPKLIIFQWRKRLQNYQKLKTLRHSVIYYINSTRAFPKWIPIYFFLIGKTILHFLRLCLSTSCMQPDMRVFSSTRGWSLQGVSFKIRTILGNDRIFQWSNVLFWTLRSISNDSKSITIPSMFTVKI